MTGFWLKIIVCPIVVLLTDWITNEVFFTSWYQAVVLGLVLAVLGHFMEVFMLKPGRLWIMTILDFFVSSAVVFLSQFLLAGAFITIVGSLLTASFLAITEYLQHAWLIRTGKTQKAV